MPRRRRSTARLAREAEALQKPSEASLRNHSSSAQSADPHLAVHAALLGQVTDAVFRIERGCVAEYRDVARVRKQDRHHHADRCCRAGAIRPDEAIQAATGMTRSRFSTAVVRPNVFVTPLKTMAGSTACLSLPKNAPIVHHGRTEDSFIEERCETPSHVMSKHKDTKARSEAKALFLFTLRIGSLCWTGREDSLPLAVCRGMPDDS
jgi:hypothetical protein